MDYLFSNSVWDELVTACPQIESQHKITRWSKYVEGNDVARPHNVAQHITSTIAAIEPIVTILLKPHLEFDVLLVKRAVDIHDVGEIECFDRGSNNDVLYHNKSDKKDLREYYRFIEIYKQFPLPVFKELLEAYLLQFSRRNPECFPTPARKIMSELAENKQNEILVFEAIERVGYVCYALEQQQTGHKKICIDTLNAQGPHLDRLAQELPGFARIFWSSQISTICEEYVEDHIEDFPSPDTEGRTAWFQE